MKTRMFLVLLLSAMTLFMSGCAEMMQSSQGRGTAYGTGIGAAVGAGLGQAIGRNTGGTLLGAGIGALVGGLAGNQYGAQLDRQQAALEQVRAQSQQDIFNLQRQNDRIVATFRNKQMFASNSADLAPWMLADLQRFAAVLNDYPQTNILIEGHTDKNGTDEYNYDLSRRRAQSVGNVLVYYGVNPARIQMVGYGESRPISAYDGENRRVEISIIPNA